MNESAAILSLPSELLCTIFLLIRETSTSTSEPRNHQVDCRWTITAVCRHFRAVALGCAKLWAFLEFGLGYGRDLWAVEVLSRSRNIPLRVTLFGDQDVDGWEMRPPVAAALLQALDPENLVGLKLHGMLTIALFDIFDSISNHPMPRLRSLSLPFDSSQLNEDQEILAISLGSSLFKGIAPSLKEVELGEYVYVSASDCTPALDNVTDLRLNTGALFRLLRDVPDPVSLSVLSVVLANMRRLKTFKLYWVYLGYPNVAPTRRSQELTWPHLEELAMNFDIQPVTMFLRYVVLPPDARLSFYLVVASDESPRSFMSALSGSWSALEKPVRRMDINTGMRTSVVRVWFDGVEGAPAMDLELEVKPQARAASVDCVVNRLNLGQLETLRIIDSVDDDILQTIFDCGSLVRHVVLPYEIFADMSGLEAPALVSVHLFSLPTVFDWSKVAETLERRRAHSFPAIRRLVLDEADGIPPEYLARLEALVEGEVEVNGLQY